MNSLFVTPAKTYLLKSDPYCCNKFGLAEFLAANLGHVYSNKAERVLDVGCGAGPIGILLADQFDCKVTGVEMNPIACACCRDNIRNYSLEENFKIYENNFTNFSSHCNDKFDLIVSNPPVNNNITKSDIEIFSNNDYSNITPELFSYITNSWHFSEDLDLTDLIFKYAQNNLNPDGTIIIVYCMIDCTDASYLTRKGSKYNYRCVKDFEGIISPISVGAESAVKDDIVAHILLFRKMMK